MILHNTYRPKTYYTALTSLPKECQDLIRQTSYEIINSRYTVYESMVFIRRELHIEGKIYDAEICLGSCDITQSNLEYDDDKQCFVDDCGKEVDRDHYAEYTAQAIYECAELENYNVYLEEV